MKNIHTTHFYHRCTKINKVWNHLSLPTTNIVTLENVLGKVSKTLSVQSRPFLYKSGGMFLMDLSQNKTCSHNRLLSEGILCLSWEFSDFVSSRAIRLVSLREDPTFQDLGVCVVSSTSNRVDLCNPYNTE